MTETLLTAPYAYALVLYSCIGGLSAMAIVWAIVRLLFRCMGYRK